MNVILVDSGYAWIWLS